MKYMYIALALVFFLMPLVSALDFSGNVSMQDRSTFDQILSPVMKIYNFVKYAATVVAVIFMVFAGISFVVSGSDQTKREQAKLMATYVIIGLVIIWVAPLVVQYVVS